MLSEEEKKAIEQLKKDMHLSQGAEGFWFEIYCDARDIDTVINLTTKLQKEVEHQKEKRENQKTELAILNEKQKEMNRLINTVSSYKGMLKKEQKDNKEKDKEIENLKIGIDEAWEEWNILEQSSCEEEQRLKAKIEEKNRIIDLMAEEIAFYQDINSYEDIKTYKKQIKQYFERRVKNG